MPEAFANKYGSKAQFRYVYKAKEGDEEIEIQATILTEQNMGAHGGKMSSIGNNVNNILGNTFNVWEAVIKRSPWSIVDKVGWPLSIL